LDGKNSASVAEAGRTGTAAWVKLRKDCRWPHFVFPGAGNGDAWKIGVWSGARTEAPLIITGSTGAGKTSVLAEASDIPALPIVHAAVDLDALGLAHLPSETANDEVMYGSLQLACRNCASRSRERFWLARNGRAR
jgi:hypothetical protein